jgi:hypothetical protein
MTDDLGDIRGTNIAGSSTPERPLTDTRWERAHQLSYRYLNGYRAANLLVRLGNILKTIGFILGAIVVLGGFIGFIISASHNRPASGIGIFLITLLYGAIIVFGNFVMGSVVAALGHLIRATQDSAVNNSPILTDDERVSIISRD